MNREEFLLRVLAVDELSDETILKLKPSVRRRLLRWFQYAEETMRGTVMQPGIYDGRTMVFLIKAINTGPLSGRKMIFYSDGKRWNRFGFLEANRIKFFVEFKAKNSPKLLSDIRAAFRNVRLFSPIQGDETTWHKKSGKDTSV